MFYIYMMTLLLIILASVRTVKSDEIYSLEQNMNIRGILALMVIFNHMFTQAYMLGNIAVSLFFCFSGYGLIRGYKNKKDYFKGYLRKKINKILIPYVLINILYCLWNVYFVERNMNILKILTSFFTAEYMPVAWYVIVQMLLYLLFFVIYKYLKVNDRTKFFILAISELIITGFLYLVGCGSWWYCSILAFAFGIFIGEKKTIIKFSKKILLVLTIMFIITYVYSYVLVIDDGIVFLLIKYSQSILICAIYSIASQKYTIKSKILRCLGENSFIIYMIHPFVFRIFSNYNFFSNFKFLEVISIILISLGISIAYWKINQILERMLKNDKIKKRV